MAIRPTLIQAIPYTKIKSKIYNDNFEMLLDYIDSTVNELNTFVTSEVNSMNNKVLNLKPMIGQPIIRLNDVLQSDEIRLEGAEVSRTTYAALFSIYGTTYGAGNGSTTFNLPDFRNKALWGADNFGYLAAGLPNIWGKFDGSSQPPYITSGTGAFRQEARGDGREAIQGGTGFYFNFDASRCSSIYGKSNTVQPPAIKIRVVTRYK